MVEIAQSYTKWSFVKKYLIISLKTVENFSLDEILKSGKSCNCRPTGLLTFPQPLVDKLKKIV